MNSLPAKKKETLRTRKIWRKWKSKQTTNTAGKQQHNVSNSFSVTQRSLASGNSIKESKCFTKSSWMKVKKYIFSPKLVERKEDLSTHQQCNLRLFHSTNKLVHIWTNVLSKPQEFTKLKVSESILSVYEGCQLTNYIWLQTTEHICLQNNRPHHVSIRASLLNSIVWQHRQVLWTCQDFKGG